MAVKHEKVRLFLLSHQESEQELAKTEEAEAKIEIYESLLLDCKDGLQALRDELLEDPEFRNRQQTGEGKVSTQHFLYTYLQVTSGFVIIHNPSHSQFNSSSFVITSL